MKIFKVRPHRRYNDWDFYEVIIVAAENEDDARLIHPDEGVKAENGKWINHNYGVTFDNGHLDWVPVNETKKLFVYHIGEASPDIKRGVILASKITS